MVTKSQKRRMLVGGTIGLILGVAISFVLFAFTNHSPIAFIFIPLAAIMGLLQALFWPAAEE